MIVVTGCRRSGTSLWMQILSEAGLPIVGEAFAPELEPLADANPNGFYESEHRYGVVGEADALRGQVLKMFAPGLLEVDEDELERVLFCLRPWRAHVASTTAFEVLEAEALGEEIPQSMPPALEWWFENYCLLGDFAERDYPMMMVAYDLVLEKPLETIQRALVFLDQDEGLAEHAVQVVDPSLRHADASTEVEVDLPDEVLATFDAFYDRVRNRDAFDDAFVDRLSATHEAVMPLIEPHLE